MAAFGTDTKQFSTLFNAVLGARKDGIVPFLNRPGIVPGGARAGAITTRITTAVTLQTPADGTLLANNAARTEVNLTAFIGGHTLSLFPYELEQWDADAEAREIDAFINAAFVQAEDEVLADLVGGTAGTTATLATGQLNFSTDKTDAEIRDNLDKLYTALVGLEVNTQGKPNDIIGITHSTAYKNLMLLADSTQGSPDIRRTEGGGLVIKGYPIYMTTATDNGFGSAADLDTFYWVHKDAEALCWSGAEVHAPMHAADDGLWKKIWVAYGYAGLMQATHYATVINGSA